MPVAIFLYNFFETAEVEEASAEQIDVEPDRLLIASEGRAAVEDGEASLEHSGRDLQGVPPGDRFARETGLGQPRISRAQKEIGGDQQFASGAIMNPDGFRRCAVGLVRQAQEFAEKAASDIILLIEISERHFDL